MASSLKAKLVLVGRSGLPPKQEWTNYLKCHDAQDNVSIQIKKIKEIEQLGSEVLVCKADVSDENAMLEVVKQTHETFGKINGVIHAAGITTADASRLTLDIDISSCKVHFYSKVYGLYVLEKLLREENLDFCVLTSSISAIVGGIGIIAYSSVSIFMDVFVHQHNQENFTGWMSLNWTGLSEEETVEAFKRIISTRNISQLIVSPRYLHEEIDRRIRLLKGKNSNTIHKNRSSQSSYIPPSNEIEEMLEYIWKEFLGIEKIGMNDNYFELGGDSLIVTQIINSILNRTEIMLSIRTFLENPSIGQQAKIMQKVYPTQIEKVISRIKRARVLAATREVNHEG